MSTKEQIIQLIEKLLFFARVENGLWQADEWNMVSYMEVRERMSRLLK